MSLLTYQEARPWARSIKQKVVAREMPPWHIDRHIGITKFKDDPSLSDAEIATIAAWVDAGAPMGNPADMPQPRQFSDLDTVVHRQARHRRDDGQALHPSAATVPTTSWTCWSIPGSRKTCTSMAIETKPADPQKLQGRPSLHDEPRRGSGRGSGRALPQRVRARQERRRLSTRLRPTDQGGNEDQFQPAPQPARGGDAGHRSSSG